MLIFIFSFSILKKLNLFVSLNYALSEGWLNQLSGAGMFEVLLLQTSNTQCGEL